MNPDEVIAEIQRTFRKIDSTDIYYALRALRIRYVSEESVEVVRACWAIHSKGLPITHGLVQAVLGNEDMNLLTKLHALGDKHVLTYLRQENRGKSIVWRLNDGLFKSITT